MGDCLSGNSFVESLYMECKTTCVDFEYFKSMGVEIPLGKDPNSILECVLPRFKVADSNFDNSSYNESWERELWKTCDWQFYQ